MKRRSARPDALLGANIELRFDDGRWYAGTVAERSLGRARPYKVLFADGSKSWHALDLETGKAEAGRRVRLKSSVTGIAKRRRTTVSSSSESESESASGSSSDSGEDAGGNSGEEDDNGSGKASGMASDGAGLSAYERHRLACIARNAAMMQTLGIAATMEQTAADLQQTALPKRRAVTGGSRARASRRPRRTAAALGPQRRSKRVAGLDADGKALPDDFDDRKMRFEQVLPADDTDSISMLPSGPSDLDVSELLVFNALRAHRSKVAAALQIETYKVAHNRTLCELVRMRPTNENELLQVWGIKEARAAKYGAGLLAVLSDPKHAKRFRSGPRPLLDVEDVEIDEAPEGSGGGAVAAGGGSVTIPPQKGKAKGKAKGGQRNGRRGTLGDVSEGEDEGDDGVCVFGGSITAFVRKYEGERWKGLGWSALDRIKPPAGAKLKGQLGTLALQHNRSHVYRKTVAAGASLGDALQVRARTAAVAYVLAVHAVLSPSFALPFSPLAGARAGGQAEVQSPHHRLHQGGGEHLVLLRGCRELPAARHSPRRAAVRQALIVYSWLRSRSCVSDRPID